VRLNQGSLSIRIVGREWCKRCQTFPTKLGQLGLPMSRLTLCIHADILLLHPQLSLPTTIMHHLFLLPTTRDFPDNTPATGRDPSARTTWVRVPSISATIFHALNAFIQRSGYGADAMMVALRSWLHPQRGYSVPFFFF